MLNYVHELPISYVIKCKHYQRMNSTEDGQLLKLGTAALDIVWPRSYIRWISSRYSVSDLSGMAGVNSTTSPIFSLHEGSLMGLWFSRGLSSSLTGNPYDVHLQLPRPIVSNRSITDEFAGNSCTDICKSQKLCQTYLASWIQCNEGNKT